MGGEEKAITLNKRWRKRWRDTQVCDQREDKQINSSTRETQEKEKTRS